MSRAAPASAEPELGSPDPSLRYLLGRLSLVERLVRSAVDRRRAVDADPGDRFRGLYISDEQVDGLLDHAAGPLVPQVDEADLTLRTALEARASEEEQAGAGLRLRTMARAFDLEPIDVELLLIALAPDLDPRFERLYGYLHDDVSRRRASVGLAIELCSPAAASDGARIRARLGPMAPLLAGRLLLIEDVDRPSLTRPLRVPDRVTAHLLGDDSPDPVVEALLTPSVAVEVAEVDVVAHGLRAGLGLVYVRERPGASGQSLGLTALARLGRPALGLDLGRMAAGDDPALIAVAASREARLRGAGLVVGPVEPLVERGATAVRAFAELPGPVILVGGRDWDPAWSRDPPLVVDAPVPALATRHDLWVTSLNGDQPEGFDPAAATIAFRLTPEQIDRAAQAARHAATAADRTMTVADVAAGARAQNAAGLERLARRIEPSVAWKDLVLPGVVEAQLRELTARARHRDRVVGEWRMGTTGARGIGITALFAGDSGTGKTMSAEVVGHDLALDVYVIDLSTVVDKYIGETEKNLDRIFTEADRVNGILLFDEADALFGKRSEVQGRPRPVRERRGRLPAPADGALRRRRDPDDQPAFQRRRGVRAAARRDHRLPDARRGAPAPAVGAQPGARAPGAGRHRPRLPRPPVQDLRRQHPQRVRDRRLPGRRRRPPGQHGRPRPRNRARVPQARPAHRRGGVRRVLRAGHGHRMKGLMETSDAAAAR